MMPSIKSAHIQEGPHPFLFYIIILLVAMEIGFVMGKKFWSRDLTLEIKQLAVQKYHALAEIKNLGIPTDFVKRSKLEREVIQIDKELTSKKERQSKEAGDYDALTNKVKYGIYIVLLVYFWKTPLLILDLSATWPISSFLAFPWLGPGAIGVSAIIAMVKAAVKPLNPLLT